ncbi:uncharacterized protein LOC123298845 [Chrysoperla carnea]|uniref:uncharacterized protein LOC123298845 n=1 Tax=Chrysoperla carnea TaxID=189513 RepID=UPI001D08541F|nr:uncharacterized protein LOC123298845 [Chrysoperla carnea]
MYHSTATNLSVLKSNELKTFLDSFDTVLTDCDGVLWRLDKVISGSPQTLNKFRDLGKRVFYITNNNIKPREYYVEKARKLGFLAEEDEILSTAYLTAEYLKGIGFNKTAYVVGSEGLAMELDRVGIKNVGIGPDELKTTYPNILDIKLDKDIGAVIVGFDPYFSFMKMLRAASYLKDPDCLFIGTNSDERFPLESTNIVIPGSGSLVMAIQTCSGRKPTIIGKPHEYVRKAIMEKYQVNPERTLMIGDRCNTDILLGTKCGFQTLLVLSGCTTYEEMMNLTKSQNEKDKQLIPDVYIAKLGDLLALMELMEYNATIKCCCPKPIKIPKEEEILNVEDNNGQTNDELGTEAIENQQCSCNRDIPGTPTITDIEMYFRKGNLTNLLSLDKDVVSKFFTLFDTILTDCDGVLWSSGKALPGSAAVLNGLRKKGKQIYFLTNNSTKTRGEFEESANKYGFQGNGNEFVSTAYLAADYLHSINFNKKVYSIGSKGLQNELKARNIECIGVGPGDVSSGNVEQYISDFKRDPDVGAVLVGFDPYFSFDKVLHAASYLIDPNILFLATNTDERFPTTKPDIAIPGTGVMVKAVETCTGRKPDIIFGKPSEYVCKYIQKQHRFDPKRALMIGDRANTDILFGKQCGMATLLVLSGITTLDESLKWRSSNDKEEKELVADFYVPTLGALLPHVEEL